MLSLGATAEYGNVLGAVFNVVTRQGSNAFHGDANFYFQNQDLTSRNTTDAQDDGLPYNRDKYHDGTVQLSGPIVKDKLWFFGSYQYQRDYQSFPGTPAEFPEKCEADRVFGKLNFQVNSKNRLMFAYHDDYYVIPGDTTATIAPSAVVGGDWTQPLAQRDLDVRAQRQDLLRGALFRLLRQGPRRSADRPASRGSSRATSISTPARSPAASTPGTTG